MASPRSKMKLLEERWLQSVFFYGLFMDADVLRRKGAEPVNIRRACVPGFTLRVGQRATLLRDPIPVSRAFGMLMELTHDEIELLYPEATLGAYRPEAVLCELCRAFTRSCFVFQPYSATGS